jgi:hypothetical protein
MNVIIYKIHCNTNNLDYYGSTKQRLKKRIWSHKNCYKRYLEGISDYYITSFDIIKNNNYIVDIVDKCDENNRIDRESYYIRNFECVNKTIPNRSQKEYIQQNKTKLSKYAKEYNEKNKEIKSQKAKEYRIKNKKIISEKSKLYYQKKKLIQNK